MAYTTDPADRAGGGRGGSADRSPDDLTARLVAARDEWLAVSFRTGPADRDGAERAMTEVYRAAGLPPPEGFVWHRSPLASLTAMAVLSLTEGQPMVWRRLWDAAAEESARLRAAAPDLAARIGSATPWPAWSPTIPPTLGNTVLDLTWYRVWEEVFCQYRAAAGGIDFSRPLEETADIVHRAGLPTMQEVGQGPDGTQVWAVVESRDMCYLGQEEVNHRVEEMLLAELAGGAATAPVHGALAALSRSAGWCWPLARTPVLTERPVTLHRDAEGRLHHDAGPAVLWPDGFAVWAWHGVPVSRDVIEQPDAITDDDIAEEFSEEVAEAVRGRREAYRRGGPTR